MCVTITNKRPPCGREIIYFANEYIGVLLSDIGQVTHTPQSSEYDLLLCGSTLVIDIEVHIYTSQKIAGRVPCQVGFVHPEDLGFSI